MKRQATDLEKVFVIHDKYKGFIWRIYTKLLQINNKKTPHLKWQKTLCNVSVNLKSLQSKKLI